MPGRYLRHFGSVEELMGLSLDTEMVIVAPIRRAIDVSASDRLRAGSEPIFSARFHRVHNEVPFCTTTVFIRDVIARDLPKYAELTMTGTRSRHTFIGLIDAHTPGGVAEAEQSVTAVEADPDLASDLGCPEGAPLLRIDRLYFNGDDTPVELAVSHFLPDQYTYRMRLRRAGGRTGTVRNLR